MSIVQVTISAVVALVISAVYYSRTPTRPEQDRELSMKLVFGTELLRNATVAAAIGFLFGKIAPASHGAAVLIAVALWIAFPSFYWLVRSFTRVCQFAGR